MKHVQIIALGLLILSCSQSNQNRIPVTYQPSQIAQRELGYIVSLPDGEQSQVAKTFGDKARIISEKQKVFEVLGKSKEEISRQFPKASVQKNAAFLVQPHPEDRLFENLAQEAAQLPNCVDNENGPHAEISVTNGSELKQTNGLLEKDQTLHLKAVANDELNFRWYLITPNAKIITGPFSTSDSYDFNPKGLGIYQVGLLAQDKEGVCGLSVLRFGFTSNPEYVHGAMNPLPRLEDMSTHFDHLNMIHAQKAWEISQGDGQIIAILDSGVNYNHPYLNENILTDSHGLVGWDFVQNDAFPFDDVGHGSHVAGLAAAQVFGVAPKAKILPVKIINIDGTTDMATAASAIYYAVDHGATVINASFGGPVDPNLDVSSSPIEAAFTYAEKKGVVIVTAAGNDTKDIDMVTQMPAGLPNLNNITVAATDFLGVLAPYSNFGSKEVKVAAPGGVSGKPIFSAEQENDNGDLFWGAEGTSMAAPVVTGIVALVRAHDKNADLNKINQILLNAGPVNAGLSGKVRSGRDIDALDALTSSHQN